MKLISLFLTFILSAQLVYANATVCGNIASCGQMAKTTKMEGMKDCPMHKSSKGSEKQEKETKSPCKCCAVLTLETKINQTPTIQATLTFIEFSYQESFHSITSSVFLRPPIA